MFLLCHADEQNLINLFPDWLKGNNLIFLKMHTLCTLLWCSRCDWLCVHFRSGGDSKWWKKPAGCGVSLDWRCRLIEEQLVKLWQFMVRLQAWIFLVLCYSATAGQRFLGRHGPLHAWVPQSSEANWGDQKKHKGSQGFIWVGQPGENTERY